MGTFDEAFWNDLHASIGVCGHCGKRRCPGRGSHTVLPKNFPFSDVTEALRVAHEAVDAEEPAE